MPYSEHSDDQKYEVDVEKAAQHCDITGSTAVILAVDDGVNRESGVFGRVRTSVLMDGAEEIADSLYPDVESNRMGERVWSRGKVKRPRLRIYRWCRHKYLTSSFHMA